MGLRGVDDPVGALTQHPGPVMHAPGLGIEVEESVDKRRREAAGTGNGDGGVGWMGRGVEKLGDKEAGTDRINVKCAHALIGLRKRPKGSRLFWIAWTSPSSTIRSPPPD